MGFDYLFNFFTAAFTVGDTFHPRMAAASRAPRNAVRTTPRVVL